MTVVLGTITNLPGTVRKHEVWLVSSSLTPHVLTLPVNCPAGEATSADYSITSNTISTGNYKLLVDRLWLSTTYFTVTAGITNPDKDVALETTPFLPDPWPLSAGETIVAGYCSGPPAVGTTIALYKTDGTFVKSGTTKVAGFFLLNHVPYGQTYTVKLAGVDMGTITVGTTYDLERFSI